MSDKAVRILSGYWTTQVLFCCHAEPHVSLFVDPYQEFTSAGGFMIIVSSVTQLFDENALSDV